MDTAIYVRVSTEEQDNENQLIVLRKYCELYNHNIVEIYQEKVSGHAIKRPELERLKADCTTDKFELVLFWSLDRLSRSGIVDTFKTLDYFTANKVSYKSYTESWLDSTSAMGELLTAITAWMAKQEWIRRSERTKAGLERVRQEGKKHIGRKPKYNWEEAKEMHAEGKSNREIAMHFNVSATAINNLFNNIRK